MPFLRRDRDSNEKRLKPIHANAGIAAAFRRFLDDMIEEMANSYVYWLKARYREHPPRLAQDKEVMPNKSVVQRPRPNIATPALALDAIPAKELERELKRLGIRWQRRFNAAAPKLAAWFAQSVEERSSSALRRILKNAGITVKFTMTQGMRDIRAATVAESVALIRSIPQQYHTEVHGLVMRSVTAGRDLSKLTRELHQRYPITLKRAKLIARDQNNKATAAFTRARYMEIGIEQAVWLHSHAGKEPRPTHLANSGKRYNINEGWFDPDPRVRKRIFPGELINCRCVAKAVVRGFS